MRTLVFTAAVVLVSCRSQCHQAASSHFESHFDFERRGEYIASDLVSKDAGRDLRDAHLTGWWFIDSVWENCGTHDVHVCARSAAEALSRAEKLANTRSEAEVLRQHVLAIQPDSNCTIGKFASETWAK